jgi:hypothetical protein
MSKLDQACQILVDGMFSICVQIMELSSNKVCMLGKQFIASNHQSYASIQYDSLWNILKFLWVEK